MITSVDTNVLLDVFVSSALHHSQSQEWLVGAYDRGAILVCDDETKEPEAGSGA